MSSVARDAIAQRPASEHEFRWKLNLLVRAPIVGLLILAAWWLLPDDPRVALRVRYHTLADIQRTPAPDLGDRVERWRLLTAGGDTVRAIWRGASVEARSTWTVVMLGGLETGDRAALLLAPDLPVNVLAVDWPWTPRRRMPASEFLLRIGAIRNAALRSPAVLAQGVEAAVCQPEVDSSRVVLLGVSLGVPTAVAALRLTRAPDALILLDGGADLRVLIEAGLRREGVHRALVPIASRIAARLIRPLEPSLHRGVDAGIRVLMINGRNDEFVPPASAELLHRTFPAGEVRWRDDAHVRPSRLDRIAALALEALAWLYRPAGTP
jgi:fermentation-respiration switch protein FrsA (DUF1100 family)